MVELRNNYLFNNLNNNSITENDSFTLEAAEMILAGHDIHSEPHLLELLHQIQQNELKHVVDKTHLPIPNSRIALGVYDQSKQLESGQVNRLFIRLNK